MINGGFTFATRLSSSTCNTIVDRGGNVVRGEEVGVHQSDGFAQRVALTGYDQGGVFLRRVIVVVG